MKRLQQFFEDKQSNITLFMLALVFFCVPLGQSAKSISIVMALITVLGASQSRIYFRNLASEPFAWAIFALVGFAILGCLWTHATWQQQAHVIEKYSKLLYVPIFAIGFIHKKNRHHAIAAYIMGIFVTLCTYLYVYWFHNPTPGSGFLPDSGYVFYNHIVVGYMTAFASYLAAWMAVNSPKIVAKVGYLILFFMFSIQMLTLNASRTGYAIYLLLGVLFIFQHFSIKYVRYTAACCLLGLVGLLQITQSHTLISGVKLANENWHAYQAGDKDTSVGLRLQFHDFAKTLFLEKPVLGQGTGGFTYRFGQDRPIPNWDPNHPDPHSQYWHTASELGIIGIILLLGLFGLLFKLSFYLIDMRAILQATVLPFAVVCCSDTVLLTSGLGYCFVIFCGLCLGELMASRYCVQAESVQSEPNFQPTVV